MKIRCVIVEDQVMFEQMLRGVINAHGHFQVVGVAHTAAQGMALCESLKPDLLLLDLELPDGNGLKIARRLAKISPDSRTIIVSGHAGSFQCPPSLRKAIYSVVDKTVGVETLMQEVLGFHRKARNLDPAIEVPLDPATVLSEREMEVFRLIGEGLGSKEISEKLGRAFLTIETHRRNITTKLKTNRGALVKMANLHNQISDLRQG